MSESKMSSSSNWTVKDSCTDFLDLRTLLHTANINTIHSALDEGVEVTQRLIIGHSKSKMCLEKLIKGSDSGLCHTGNDPLIQDNVEILDAVLTFPEAQEKALSRASFLEECLLASPYLREKCMNHMEYNLEFATASAGN